MWLLLTGDVSCPEPGNAALCTSSTSSHTKTYSRAPHLTIGGFWQNKGALRECWEHASKLSQASYCSICSGMVMVSSG